MPVEYDFIEGIDPTPMAEISASQLLQLIRQALPQTHRGGIIYSQTSPDIVANPHLKRYLWINQSLNPMEFRGYSIFTLSWEKITLGSASITNIMIQNGVINLNKLNPYYTGGGPLKLIRINAAGDGFEFFDFSLGPGSIAYTQISKGTGNADKFLHVADDDSAVEWFNLDASSYIPIHGLDLNRLTLGTNNKFIRQIAGVGVWDDVPLELIKLTLPASLQQVRVNALGTALELFTPPAASSGQLIAVHGHVRSNLPANGTTFDIALTKPTGTVWKNFELFVSAPHILTTGHSVGMTFTYQTAPEVGTVPGSGNSGIYYVGSGGLDFYTGKQFGNVIASLQATDIITFRVAQLFSTSGGLSAIDFYAKAYYA